MDHTKNAKSQRIEVLKDNANLSNIVWMIEKFFFFFLVTVSANPF